MSAVRSVLDYLFGLGFFGFLFWLLNGIMPTIRGMSETGDLYDLANFMWTATLVVYLVFGAFWLPRKLKEWDYVR